MADEFRVLDDDEGDKDQPVPMALEHTEVVSNEKTQTVRAF